MLDFTLVTDNSSLYIIELTVRFESSMEINSDHKIQSIVL